MLQTFRSHLLGWFSKILIGLISIAFALFGIEYYLVNSHSNQSIATVNGEKISSAQLTVAYNRNRNRLMNQYGTKLALTSELQEKLRKQSLDELITREIIFQGARKAGFMTTPLAVQATIEQMPAFQVDKQFSPELLQRVLYNLGYTEKTFYDEMAQALTVGQLSDGLAQSAFALTNEIDRTYEVSQQKRDFNTLILPIHQFEREVKLSDAEIKTFYDAHRDNFQSQAQVSVDYVELNINDLKAKQTVTEREIQDFYHNSPESFSTPARWQVAKVVVPVAAEAKDKDLEEAQARVKLLADQLKKEHKLPAEAKKEWVEASTETKDLVKLFATMKVGQVSEPQQQNEGLVVYKLLAGEAPKPQPLNVVSESVKQALLKQKAEREFTSRSDQLAELAFTHPDSLAPLAEALGSPIKSTGLFTHQQESQEGLESSPKVRSAAFSDEVLQQSSNSNPIDLGHGRIVVLRLKSSQPAHVMSLDSVKEKIVAILKRQQAEVAMAKLGLSMVEMLRSGKNVNELLNAHQLRWQPRVNVSRQESGLDRDLIQLAFRQPDPKGKGVSVDGASLKNGDYAIVSVEKVIPANSKTLAGDQRESIKKSLALNYGMSDFNLYVKELKEKAKVNAGVEKTNSNAPNIADDY